MKVFLYCENTEGGMVVTTHMEHQLNDLLKLMAPRGFRPGDKVFEDCKAEDDNLITAALIVEVGTVLPHRLGILVRLKDDHQPVS